MDEHVNFVNMKDGTREEYELLARLEKPYLALTADRVLEELKRAGEATLMIQTKELEQIPEQTLLPTALK